MNTITRFTPSFSGGRLLAFAFAALMLVLIAFEPIFAQSIPAPEIPGATGTSPWDSLKTLFGLIAKMLLWGVLISAFVAAAWILVTGLSKAWRDRDIGGLVLYMGLGFAVVLIVWFLAYQGDTILTSFLGGA